MMEQQQEQDLPAMSQHLVCLWNWIPDRFQAWLNTLFISLVFIALQTCHPSSILKMSCEIVSEAIQKARWLLTIHVFLPVSFGTMKKKNKIQCSDMIHYDQPRWLVFMSLLSQRFLMLFDYFFKFLVCIVCLFQNSTFLLKYGAIFWLSFTSLLQKNSGIISVGSLPKMKFIQLSDLGII